jgi:hypothetical protein
MACRTKEATVPDRIQLSRAKGWKMPPNTVKVDRTTRYGNPYRPGMFRDFTAADAVRHFRSWVSGDLSHRSAGIPPDLEPLRGKNLACWCKPGEPCHADVLLELANTAVGGVPGPNQEN